LKKGKTLKREKIPIERTWVNVTWGDKDSEERSLFLYQNVSKNRSERDKRDLGGQGV